MANSQREQQPTEERKTESEREHFMDSKENKLHYFIQLELLCLKNLAKIFGEEQSSKYQRLLPAQYGELKIQGWYCKQTTVL